MNNQKLYWDTYWTSFTTGTWSRYFGKKLKLKYWMVKINSVSSYVKDLNCKKYC
jgi:hypothetical protein